MKYWIRLGLPLFAMSQSLLAAVPLDCGKVPGFQVAAELVTPQPKMDSYNLQVTYIGPKPANKLIDKSLRECLNVVIKLDNTKDISASAWARKSMRSNPDDDVTLNPYGFENALSFSAKTKTAKVQNWLDKVVPAKP